MRRHTDGIIARRRDRGTGIVVDIDFATITGAAAATTKGDNSARGTSITAGTAETLRKDTVSIRTGRDHRAIIVDPDRRTIAARGTGIGVTNNAEAGARIAGIAAHGQRQNAVGAVTGCADRTVIGHSDIAALGRITGRTTIGPDKARTAIAPAPGAALGEDAVRAIAGGRDRDGRGHIDRTAAATCSAFITLESKTKGIATLAAIATDRNNADTRQIIADRVDIAPAG